MGTISVWHWLIVAIWIASTIVPFWKIFPRAGWPAPLAILMVVPVLNLVLLWALAFKTWPNDRIG